MKKMILLTMMPLLVNLSMSAQVPTVKWNKTYNNLGYSPGICVAALPNQNILVGTAEGRILSFDSSGNNPTVFHQISSGPSDQHFTTIHVNPDQTITGNFTGSGYSSSLIELNYSGMLLKNQNVNFGQTFVQDINKRLDGSYILAGAKNCGGLGGGWDGRLGTLYNDGTSTWNKIHCLICGCVGGFCDYGDELLFSTKQSNDGNMYSVGYNRKGGSGCYETSNAWIVKADSIGNEIWNKSYGLNGDDQFFSVELTNTGKIIAFGFSTNAQGNKDFLAVCYDIQGNMLWEKNLGSTADEIGRSMISLGNDEFLLSGYQKDAQGKWNLLVYKIDASGNEIWQLPIVIPSGIDVTTEDWVGNCITKLTNEEYILTYTYGNWVNNMANLGMIKIAVTNSTPPCQPTTSTTNLSIPSSQLPYTWNGLTFTAAGTKIDTLTNAAGCDSLATLNLAITNDIPAYLPTNGLVGYWPFNGNAHDESGNGNNGTVNGATSTTDRFGNAGKAYGFDGVDDYIKCLQAGPSGNPTVTAVFWLKTAQTSYGHLIGYGGNGETGNDFRVLIEQNCQNSMCFDTYGNLYALNDQRNNSIWSQYIVIYDGSLGNNVTSSKIYKNGSLMTSICTQLNSSSTNIQSVFPITFGKYHGTVQDGYFSGILDDIAIYNRALTPQEISTLYQSQSTNSEDTGTTLPHDTLRVGINVSNPQRNLHVKDVMRLEPRQAAPANPAEGDIYYDGTRKKLRLFDGRSWTDL